MVIDVEEQTMEALAFGQSVEEWLAAFPVADARSKLERLRTQRASLDLDIGRLERLIETLTADAAPAPVANGNGHRPTRDVPQGMDAVEIVMRDRPGIWARHEIGVALVERGWLAEGESGTGTLGSIMYRMVKRGRIVRLDGGRYRLPDSQQEVLVA